MQSGYYFKLTDSPVALGNITQSAPENYFLYLMVSTHFGTALNKEPYNWFGFQASLYKKWK